MTIPIPPEYAGREQTYFKHLILHLYLVKFGPKLASLARFRAITLWYCDVFAGPWKSQSGDYRDTSVYVGLTAMREARRIWQERGITVQLAAAFVEKDPNSLAELKRLCEQFADEIGIHVFDGTFQDRVSAINSMIGENPAFVLVDPTGWSGAGMDYVARLAKGRWRDVMIRIPSEAHRFKGRPEVREEMANFFGVGPEDLGPEVEQDELIRRYCRQLKRRAALQLSAEMAVPYARSRAISCWLAVGGHHSEVLKVFRDVEYEVLGIEAAGVRSEVEAPGQLSFLEPADSFDYLYNDYHRTAEREILAKVELILRNGAMSYGGLWPQLLEQFHLREVEAAEAVRGMIGTHLLVQGMEPKKRRLRDHHMLSLIAPPAAPTPQRVQGAARRAS
jgi:three-Cys-motif partner protein